ncbi:TraM recognition domain-containing protein [Catalinimonas sp. 4WD22]|uniref:VirB4 family type IV secretion system protein n=1 Tax=Catalinimonas locisalis TaxID=3133978 RepID=UPI003100F7C6
MINLINRPKRRRDERDLREAIPIFSFENNKVVFRDGHVAVGFRIHAAEMETWSAAHYASFNNSLAQQLSSFPEEAVLQKTDVYYFEEYQGDAGAREYFELKTQQHFAHSMVLHHKGYLFISFPPQNKKRNSIHPFNTLLMASKSMLGNAFGQIEEALEKVELQATEFINGLQGVHGVSFSRMREEELKIMYSQYYTLNFEEDNHQNLACAVSADLDGIQVGEKRLNLISMRSRGNFIEDAVMNVHGVTAPYTYLLGNYMQIPHITTTTIKIENTEKELSRLDQNRFWNSTMDWMGTQDNDLAGGNIEEFTAMIRNSSQRLVSVSVNVMIYDSDQAIRQNYLEQAKRDMRSIANSECIVESSDTLALYFANTPGNAYNNYRWMLMSDEMACKYFNFISNTRSATHGDMLCDRFRNPVQVNFFNTSLTNQNAIIVGETGGGKSFTNGYFMIQRKERGARQVIIDVGGTYRNTLLMLNGEQFEDTYFEYDPQKPMAFAPFQVTQDEHGKYMYGDDKLDFLLSLLSTMWKGVDAVNSIKNIEKSILLEILISYYAHINEHKLPAKFNTFYEFCQELRKSAAHNEDLKADFQYFDIVEFLRVLRPFYNGPMKELLNGEKQRDLSEYPLICFDLARIQEKEMIYPIVTQLIIQLVLDQLDRFPDDEKFIYIDEAWSMLEGTLGDFMQAMFRTIRKLNGSIWIITQNINDITSSIHHKAILANAATKVILRHTDAKLAEEAASALGFTNHARELLFSLRDGGDFRDILVKMGEDVRVYALEAPPQHAAVLSSKPKERNEFRRLMKKYGSQALALEEFVAQKMSVV